MGTKNIRRNITEKIFFEKTLFLKSKYYPQRETCHRIDIESMISTLI